MNLQRKTMHKSVVDYINKIKYLYPFRFTDTTVLDCWSLDINWSNRQFFDNSQYIWVDIGDGKWVDYICDIKDFNPWKQYEVVISTSMLEHNKNWKEWLLNMYKLTKKWWMLIWTCANINFPEHWTSRKSPHQSPVTNDYYCNLTPSDILEVLPSAMVSESEDKKDTYFYLIKQ